MQFDFEKGKFFVSDQAINNIDDDFFGHNDFALALENIMKTQPIPHNIAIIGKWGIGKSSIIELIKNRIQNKEFNGNVFRVIEINAWKYEKDTFQKVFLKKSWNALGGTEEDWANTLMKILSEASITEKTVPQKSVEEIKNETVKEKLKNVREWIWKSVVETVKFLLSCALLYLFTLGSLGIWAFIKYLLTKDISAPVSIVLEQGENASSSIFAVKDQIALFFSQNTFIPSSLAIASGLFLKWIESYKQKKNRTFTITAPVKSSDEYEILLKSKLPDDGKDVLVSIIDDIDRLSSAKMIEALDAIKAFSDIKKCIFIVPFDDSKIKKAYNEKISAGLSECMTDDYISCELMLDKLFQYRIELPPLVKKDLIPYAIKLVDNQAPDLRDKVNVVWPKLFEETIIPILIPTHIHTPRALKKIINTFAMNYILAKSRSEVEMQEINNKLQLIFDARLIQSIALLSVIQCEFPEIYEKLLTYPQILFDICQDYESAGLSIEDQPANDDTQVSALDNIKSELKNYNDLISFLIRSKHLIKIEKKVLNSLIFMSDSLAALKSGGKEYELTLALSNGNSVEALEILKNVKDSSEILRNELITGRLNPAVERQYLVAIYPMFETLNGDKRNLANALITKTLIARSISSFDEQVSISMASALQVYLFADSDEKANFVEFVIEKINNLPLEITSYNTIKHISSGFNLIILEQMKVDLRILDVFKEKLKLLSPLDDKLFDFKDFIDTLDQSFDKIEVISKFCPTEFLKILSIIASEEETKDSIIIDTLALLVNEYISNKKYSEMCNEIYVALQVFIGFDTLKDTLLSIKNKISNQDALLLIEAVSQIALTADNSKPILDFINALDCTYDECTSIEVDQVLSTCINFKEIDSIVLKILESKQISSLSKTIAAINKNIFEEDTKHILFSSIHSEYSEEQKKEFISLFSSAIDVMESNEAIKRTVDLINNCYDCLLLSEWLAPYIESSISHFGRYYSSYPKWAEQMVTIIGQLTNGISQSAKINYYSYLQAAFSSYPDISIKAWRYLPLEDETKEQTEFIVKSVLSLTKAEDYIDVYKTLSQREALCLETDLDNYCLWLFACLTEDGIYNEVVNTIESLDVVTNLDNLFSHSCAFEVNKKERIKSIIVKHLVLANNKNEILTEALFNSDDFKAAYFNEIVDLVYNGSKEFYVSLIQSINLESSAKRIERVLNTYLEVKDADSNLLVHLVGLLSQKGNEIDIENLVLLLSRIKFLIRKKRNIKAQFQGHLEILLKSIKSEDGKEKLQALLQ